MRNKTFLIRLAAASAIAGVAATAYGQSSLSGSVDAGNAASPAGSFNGTINSRGQGWTSTSPGTAPTITKSVSPGGISSDRAQGGTGIGGAGTSGSPATVPAAPGVGAGIGSDTSTSTGGSTRSDTGAGIGADTAGYPANGVGTGIGSSNGAGSAAISGGGGR